MKDCHQIPRYVAIVLPITTNLNLILTWDNMVSYQGVFHVQTLGSCHGICNLIATLYGFPHGPITTDLVYCTGISSMLDQKPDNVNNPFIGSKEQGCPPRGLEGWKLHTVISCS